MFEQERIEHKFKLLRSDEARRRLTEEILSGKLAPGKHLDEIGTATRLGMSRTPVREAFQHLAATGLVENRPHRGVVVAELALERALDAVEAVAEIESACARLAAVRMEPEERVELQLLIEEGDRLLAAGDADGLMALDGALHAAILRGTHNVTLQDTVSRMRDLIRFFSSMLPCDTAWLARMHKSHVLLVAAIVAADGSGAQRAMRAHVQAERKRLSVMSVTRMVVPKGKPAAAVRRC
jgi:DNA-binding GntR family transcriptional regulator